MACEVLRARDGVMGCDGDGCDYHHMKSGNIRRGHMFGVGLCAYHHRGHPIDCLNSRQMRGFFGPSLMDGGKKFAAVFGTDEELLQRENDWLGEGND